MSSFNLSDWALRHRSFVLYLMLVSAVAGVYAYGKLGREEDPPFTIKTMVVRTLWPGATTTDTLQLRSPTGSRRSSRNCRISITSAAIPSPANSLVFVNLEGLDAGQRGRRPVVSGAQEGRRHPQTSCRRASQGPFFNDEFGDTYSRRLRLHLRRLQSARTARRTSSACAPNCCACPTSPRSISSARRTRRSIIEFSTQQMAALGIDASALLARRCRRRTRSSPSGVVDAGPERIAVRVSGEFTSEESLKALNFRHNGRFFRLTDIATIRRGYVDPPQPHVPLQRRAGDRPRHLDGAGRRRAERSARQHQGAHGAADARPAGRRRAASRRRPAARRATRPSANSPRRCGRPSSSCWRSASSRSAGGRASSSRSRSRWCSRSRSW